MRLDKFLHAHPVLYRKRVILVDKAKNRIYKILRVEQTREYGVELFSQKYSNVLERYSTNSKILDIGCGRGEFMAKQSQEYGAKCIGIDISPEMIKYAKTVHPDMIFIQASCDNLPFTDNIFDVAMLNDVIHHLPLNSRRKAIDDALRVAKIIIIRDNVNFDNDFARILANIHWKLTDGSYRNNTKKQWLKLLDVYDIKQKELGNNPFMRWCFFVVSCK